MGKIWQFHPRFEDSVKKKKNIWEEEGRSPQDQTNTTERMTIKPIYLYPKSHIPGLFKR